MSTLFIFYGSATGNAEHIAKDLASKSPPAPFTKIECDAMEKYKKYEKAWESAPSGTDETNFSKHGMLLITSTTGNGDAPENAGRFVRYLKRKTTVEKQPFQHVAYATLGLGDTNYDQFCATAKIVDKKMMELGGTKIQSLVCADEGTGNLESVVEPWTDTIFANVAQACCASDSSPNGSSETPSKNEDEPKSLLSSSSSPPATPSKIEESSKQRVPTVTKTATPANPTSTTTATTTTTTNKSLSPLVILYGSATGNAEHIAKDLCQTYKTILQNPISKCYFTDVICCEADQFKKQKLVEKYWSVEPSDAGTKHGLLIITSTTGNGDVPDNAGRFVRFLKRKSTVEQQPFQHVAYAVLGLGDTNYDQFCETAKVVDRKIGELGGTKVQPLACADEGTGNLESVVDPWVNSILLTITNACRGHDGNGDNSATTNTTTAAPTSTTKTPPPTTTTTATKATPVETSVVISTTAIPPTKSNSTVSTSSSNEEKKMETMDSVVVMKEEEEEVGQEQKSSGIGVQILRSLLSCTSSSCIPQVDHSTLPSLGTRLSSCELIHYGVEEQVEQQQSDGGGGEGGTRTRQRSRGYSLVEMAEQMTVSSASSSALHYTITKPYESTILNARYLTNTSTKAAKTVSETIGMDNITAAATPNGNNENINKGSNEYDKDMIQAVNVYNTHFPLVPSTSKDDNKNDKKEKLLLEQNSKRVIEMTLSLPDDFTLEYKPGDSLGMLVPNAPSHVRFVLDMLQRHHSMDTCTQKVSLDSNSPITVDEAIRYHIDLGSPLKQNNKRILHYLSQFATNAEEEIALRLLASKTTHGESLFRQYVEEQCLTVVDILQDFPSCQSIPLEGLLGVLPGIPPRYYSVSSSPLDKEHSTSSPSLTVTFSVVDYVTPPLGLTNDNGVVAVGVAGGLCGGGQRRKRGIATGYLELLCSPFLASCGNNDSSSSSSSTVQGSNVPSLKIFPKPTAEFRLPETITTPLILIGPGTGIAPFMGFLSHRQAEILSMNSATDAATSVVEGTWRGDYELEGEDAIPITKRDSSGLNVGIEFRRGQRVGSVDVFFGCRYANHDWLYQSELDHYLSNGTISKLYTGFSRDMGGTTTSSSSGADTNHTKCRGYVQDIMKNNEDCKSRLINLILKENASVYVCGDGNAMARDVQGAIVDILAMEFEKENDNNKNDKADKGEEEHVVYKEKAKKYLEQMKAKERFVLDIWTS